MHQWDLIRYPDSGWRGIILYTSTQKKNIVISLHFQLYKDSNSKISHDNPKICLMSFTVYYRVKFPSHGQVICPLEWGGYYLEILSWSKYWSPLLSGVDIREGIWS